jgi:hypothetical protein
MVTTAQTDTIALTISGDAWESDAEFTAEVNGRGSGDGTTPAASAPADRLTGHLSEDAWKSDAEFEIHIDGKAVAAPGTMPTQPEASPSRVT